MKEFVITKKEEGLTLLKFSSRILHEAPLGMIRKFLRNKNIELNRKRSDGSDRLKEGDSVCFFLSDETFGKFSGTDGNLKGSSVILRKNEVPDLDLKRIIYEDRDYLFYDKPAGILSQGDAKGKPSINDSLLKHTGISGTVRASVCNRLDLNTSGLILCGKTYSGLTTLDEAIKNRRIEKYYLCVLEGSLEKEGELTAYLKKDHTANKADISAVRKQGYDEIVTGYKILKKTDSYTLCEVHLVTGKPHQIRAMSAFLGNPVVGDVKYGAKKDRAGRQLLHSGRAVMPQDILDGREFTAPVPEDMQKYM